MTKKETEAKILEYHAAGDDSVRIAKTMGLTREYVRNVIRDAQRAEREAAGFAEEWDKARFRIRNVVERERAAEQRRREMMKRVVYVRCTSWSGYWWLSGFDFSRPDHRGEK